MDKSIYEYISEAVVDGRLPEGFSLPRQEGEKGVALADGALEGIMLYHRAPGHTLTDEQTELIGSLIKQVSDGEFYDAEESLWRVADEIGALDARDTVRDYIVNNQAELNLGNVFDFALTMAVRSPSRKVVKLALVMLEVFDPDDQVKGFIRTLGLSDDFTLFAAMAMGAWEDTNDEWYDLARKVRGWGRIHLVRFLRPETEAIRRWLLREGVHNDVMPQYAALDCWRKADVPAALSGTLTREDFEGIRDIIDALLDEGPVPGISAVEDAEQHLRAFLKHAEAMARDEHDREVVEAVKEYLKQN